MASSIYCVVSGPFIGMPVPTYRLVSGPYICMSLFSGRSLTTLSECQSLFTGWSMILYWHASLDLLVGLWALLSARSYLLGDLKTPLSGRIRHADHHFYKGSKFKMTPAPTYWVVSGPFIGVLCRAAPDSSSSSSSSSEDPASGGCGDCRVTLLLEVCSVFGCGRWQTNLGSLPRAHTSSNSWNDTIIGKL